MATNKLLYANMTITCPMPGNKAAYATYSLPIIDTQTEHAQTHTCSHILFPELRRQNTQLTTMTGQGSKRNEVQKPGQRRETRELTYVQT